MNNLTKKRKLVFLASYIVVFALSLMVHAPGYLANEDFKYQLGKREISEVPRYTEQTIRYWVGRALDPEVGTLDGRWGAQYSKSYDKNPETLFALDSELRYWEGILEKTALESRSDETYSFFFNRDCEEWRVQVQTLRLEFHQLYSAWYSKEELSQARIRYGSHEIYDSNTGWKNEQAQRITMYRVAGGGAYFLLWLLFLVVSAKFIKGFSWREMRYEARRIPLLAVVGPIAAVWFLFAQPLAKLMLLAKLAAAAAQAFGAMVAARATALAYGLATMLACAVSIGAANAQTTSAQKSKSKTNSAWIKDGQSDGRSLAERLDDGLAAVLAKEAHNRFMNGLAVVSQTPAPTATGAATPKWKYSLDAKTAVEQGGTLAEAVRFTSVRRDGFLIENVASVSQGPLLRTVADECVIGDDVLKTGTVTVNAVVGGKFSVTSNSKTQSTVFKEWVLAGMQVFVSTRRWAFNLPVFRAEIPIASQGTRLGFASNHELRYKFTPRFQVGEETFFARAMGQAAVRIHGLTARVRPSVRWPWFEAAVFKNFFNDHWSARARMSISW